MRRVFGALLATILAACSAARDTGTWTTLESNWGLMPIHVIMLPNGDLLVMNRERNYIGVPFRKVVVSSSSPYRFDLVREAVGDTNEIFCAGHTFLRDGTVFMAGGHNGRDADGLPDVYLYGNDRFRRQEDMTAGARWYPTTIALPDGSVFIGSGTDDPGQTINTPTLWTNQTDAGARDYQATLTEKSLYVFYPFLFIDPLDGNLFYSSPFPDSKGGEVLDLRTLEWRLDTPLGVPGTLQDYASALMIDGIVVQSGGSDYDRDTGPQPATNRVIFADLNEPREKRRFVAGPPMVLPRKNHTLVGLPNGMVMAVGGNLRGKYDYATENERISPEWWNPATPTRPWQLLAPAEPALGRGYHSVGFLLPDARVFVGGGEEISETFGEVKPNQIFSPPYAGTNDWARGRPIILPEGAPDVIRYGESFPVPVRLADDREVSRVMLVSLPSVTHGFNMNQQIVELEFQQQGSRLQVVAPEAPRLATEGYYMLFVVDDRSSEDPNVADGVPSEAAIVRLVDAEPIPLQDATVLFGRAAAAADKSELFLSENRYLASGITEDPTTGSVQLLMVGASPRLRTTSVRLDLQAYTQGSALLKVEAYNWLSHTFDLIDERIAPGDETDLSYNTPQVSWEESPYIDEDTREIMWRLTWKKVRIGTDLTVFLDRARISLR